MPQSIYERRAHDRAERRRLRGVERRFIERRTAAQRLAHREQDPAQAARIMGAVGAITAIIGRLKSRRNAAKGR